MKADPTVTGASAGSTVAGMAGQVPKESDKVANSTTAGTSTSSTVADMAGKVPKESDKSANPTMAGTSTSSTVADMAGNVPKESEKSANPTMAGTSTSSTIADMVGKVPKESEKSANPTMADASTSSTVADMADKVPKESEKGANLTMAGTSTSSTVADMAGQVPKEGGSSGLPGAFPETPQQEANEFGVKPIPATKGIGNPIHLKPGEPVPDPSTLTPHTVDSTVDHTGSGISSTGQPKGAPSSDKKETMIPESSLPMGAAAAAGAAATGPTIQSAGGNSTTAQMAAQVPIEPRGVPEVVEKSQQAAHTSPEASANPTAVGEKGAMEKELTDKVPAEPAAEDSSMGGKVAGYATGAAAAATAAVSGAAAYFGSGKATDDAKAKLPESAHPAIDKATPAVEGAAGKIGGDPSQATTSTVPDAVKESIADAHKSPEAETNKAAVAEKADVEQELLKKGPKEDMAGEPAPVAATATSATAPKATGAVSAPGASLKSTEKPLPTEGGAGAASAANGKTPAKDTPAKDAPSTPAKDTPAKDAPAKDSSTATPAVASLPTPATGKGRGDARPQ